MHRPGSNSGAPGPAAPGDAASACVLHFARGKSHQQAQRLDHALLAPEVLPQLSVEEDGVPEVAPQVRVAVGPSPVREVDLGKLGERLSARMLVSYVVAHTCLALPWWPFVR